MAAADAAGDGSNPTDTLVKLLEFGAHANVCNKACETPLHLLLNRPAPPNTTASGGAGAPSLRTRAVSERAAAASARAVLEQVAADRYSLQFAVCSLQFTVHSGVVVVVSWCRGRGRGEAVQS
jgi:hypothetical protein